MEDFFEVIQGSFPLLEQYTAVLAKVHGGAHTELAKVRDVFKEMNDKVENQAVDRVNLSAEFRELRTITDNYAVPSDGCETYEATYEMLGRADKVHHE